MKTDAPLSSHPETRETWFKRETSDNFARLIISLDEVDVSIREAIQQALLPGEALRDLPGKSPNRPLGKLIYAPYQGLLPRRGKPRTFFNFLLPWEFTPTWYLGLTADRLLMVRLAPKGNRLVLDAGPRVTAIPLEAIISIQIGVVLLFSWLEITWAENGAARKETVYFNAVCDFLFFHLAAMLRSQIAGEPVELNDLLADREPHPDPASLQALSALPYKFKNLIPMRGLLPKEQIFRLVYRPAIWRSQLHLFRVQAAPRLVLLRTNHHLLFVEEEIAQMKEGYGLITTFVPAANVCSIAVEQKNATRSYLIIQAGLQGAAQEWRVPFSNQDTGVELLTDAGPFALSVFAAEWAERIGKKVP